jgi:TonB family protein
VRVLYPSVVSALEHTFRSVMLVSTPVPVNHQPQPVVHLPQPTFVARLDPPVEALRLPAPQPKPSAKVESEVAPTVPIAAKKIDPLPLNPAPVVPKQGVKTNTFSTGSSATPTIARAPSQVQTGGFGDPNGLPAKANQGKAVNVAALGSFDLPSGQGYGNGSGGAKGAPGVVASTGFGNGTATGSSRQRSTATVQAGGFTDAEVPAARAVRSQVADPIARAVPAEILSKPTPVYTQEAKVLRIQGEVLLEVVLEASGSLRVLRVVSGLGHGLDDNAVKAAEQIHFKPAMRDGQPTDSTVVLHIIFQLA